MTSNFLNDFTLVASSQGGPDNVTVTCLELSNDGQTHTLQVARKSNHGSNAFKEMNDMIAIMSEEPFTGLIIS